MTAFQGGCLCGAVRYEGSEPKGGGHCHCVDCRKSSGTGHCSHMVVAENSFHVAGEVRFFDAPTDAGNRVSRGFCPTCGSAIYSTNTSMQGMVIVRASSLDDPDIFTPEMVVYTKRAPNWDLVDPTLPSFEEMPPPADLAKVVA